MISCQHRPLCSHPGVPRPTWAHSQSIALLKSHSPLTVHSPLTDHTRTAGRPMSRCAAALSCESCVSVLPPPIDNGVRCVWCPSDGKCLEYVKHSFSFPCHDATRSGGGYPGGATCRMPSRPMTPASGASSAVQIGRGRSVFSHTPSSSAAVTVVIPSFQRPSNLFFSLPWLLRLEPLQRPGSEVIVSHGSARSFGTREALDVNISAAWAPLRCAPVHHIDATATNRKYYASHRFFTAKEHASPANVLLHVDDDLVPTEPMLQALIDRAAVARVGQLFGPSGHGRSCGRGGYSRGDQPLESSSIAVLTNLAATSASSNAHFVAVFSRYAPMLERTRGNGEDLAFAHAMRAHAAGRWVSSELLGQCAGDVDDHAGTARQDVRAKMSRDACGLSSGEFAFVRGAKADEMWAARSGEFHTRHDHYKVLTLTPTLTLTITLTLTLTPTLPHTRHDHDKVRDRICRCLSAALEGEQLADCVAARPDQHVPDEL